MRISRRVSAAIVVAFTLASTLPVRGAEPPRTPVRVDPGKVAELPDNAGPIAVEGKLLDSWGRPTGGTVQALAWPADRVLSRTEVGATVERLPVAAARAGPDGRFALRLSRASLPPEYVSVDGQVDLELSAWNATGQRRWFASVRSDIADGASVWLAPTADRSVRASEVAEKRVQASIRLAEPLEARPDRDVQPAAPNPCHGGTLVSTHNVWVLIGRSMTNESGQTSWMHDGSSQSVTLGVAVSSESSFGYSASGTLSTTTGVDFTWAESSADRRYYVQTQYGKYRFVCAGQIHFTFRPRMPTGGFSHTVASFNPAWTANCVPVSPGTWTRDRTDGSTTKYGGGVEATGSIGINLSFESNYSSTRTLSYRLTLSGRVCGSNNIPALASEVEAET